MRIGHIYVKGPFLETLIVSMAKNGQSAPAKLSHIKTFTGTEIAETVFYRLFYGYRSDRDNDFLLHDRIPSGSALTQVIGVQQAISLELGQ